MGNDSASGSKSSSLAKASSQRLGAGLRRPEDLHKRTGLHLRIPDGKRLKLHHDPPSHSVRPRGRMTNKGPKFDFDTRSSAPKQGDGVTGGTSLVEVSDSDEFPEPVELVRASIRDSGQPDGSLASHTSDYSDSDIDNLIRDAVLGGITSTGIDSTKTRDSSVPTLTHSPQVGMLVIRKFLLLQMTRRAN
jgi:hypothetical protein